MSAVSSPGVVQVTALPISSSGSGNSAAASQLNNVNENLAATALQAGNSETIIKTHYYQHMTTDEAAPFWRIVPHKTKGAVIASGPAGSPPSTQKSPKQTQKKPPKT